MITTLFIFSRKFLLYNIINLCFLLKNLITLYLRVYLHTFKVPAIVTTFSTHHNNYTNYKYIIYIYIYLFFNFFFRAFGLFLGSRFALMGQRAFAPSGHPPAGAPVIRVINGTAFRPRTVRARQTTARDVTAARAPHAGATGARHGRPADETWRPVREMGTGRTPHGFVQLQFIQLFDELGQLR